LLLAGFAFANAGLEGVVIGVFAPDSEDFYDSFTGGLEGSSFEVVKFDSLDTCLSDMDTNDVNACVSLADQEVDFYVDPSQVNLIYTILNALTQSTSMTSDEISSQIASGLLQQMNSLYTQLGEGEQTIRDLSSQGMQLSQQLTAIQQGIDEIDIQIGNPSQTIQDFQQSNLEADGQIKEFDSLIDANLQDTRKDVIAVRSDLDASEQLLVSQRDQLVDEQERVSSMFSESGCSSNSSVDMSPMLDSYDDLQQALVASSNPTCSVLYTMDLQFQQQISDLDLLQKDIDDTQQKLDDFEGRLDTVDSEVNATVSEARESSRKNSLALENARKEAQGFEEDAEQAKEQQAELSQQLSEMNSQIISSNELLDSFAGSLKDAQDSSSSFKDLSVESIIDPVVTSVEGLDDGRGAVDYLFPMLILFVLMFVSLMLGSTFTLKERNSRAFFRNIISPSTDSLFLLGTYLTSVLIVFAQVIILFILSFFIVSAPFSMISIAYSLLIVLLCCIVFVSMGMIIGHIVSSQETAVITAVVCAITMLLFSNSLLPINSMPATLQLIASFNPFFAGSELLRSILLSEASPWNMLFELGVLIIFSLLLLVGVRVSFISARKQAAQ
jgi:predicted  nucleic acid-binding Zn-ribbon protein